MKTSSYISLSISNATMIIVAKNEDEARKLLEQLKNFGIEAESLFTSICG